MKAESLHALVIDHHSGELSPEVVDLLEAYLALHPAARNEAAEIVDALTLTSAAVEQHPECVRVRVWSPPEAKPQRRVALPTWMKAAAVIAFSALTTAGGFYAGSRRFGGTANTPAFASVSVTPRKNSPWAQYRMAPDPHGGGLQVVRVSIEEKEGRP